MAKREFKEPVLQAPNTPKKRTARIVARTLLGRHHAHCTLSPRLLHVDFGCGPGTASWAAIRNLSGRVTLVTVGHDHNRHMTKLAKRIVRDISNTAHGATYKFFSNWIIFEALAKWLAARRYDIVLVTVNSLFGQRSVGDDDINRIVSLIATIRERARESAMFVIGTHPPFELDRVEAAWQRIANTSGGDMRYNGNVPFDSWNPIRSGNYEPHDGNAWSMWRGGPQLGHIVEVNG